MDYESFGRYFIKWTREICDLTEGGIAIDGKTIRGAYNQKGEKSTVHIVSAYARDNRLCLGQVQTAEKSNEIKAIPELLDLLFIEGSTVTIDAMGCQKKIIEKIISKNANYVVAVKSNQKSLYEQIKKLFEITKIASENTQRDVDHGRVEIRKCSVIDDFTFSMTITKNGRVK